MVVSPSPNEYLLIQLLEKDEASSSSIFLMVLYDDLFRRHLAQRALAGEPELDVNKCFQSRDDTILEAARVRLTSVLISAGLRRHLPHYQLPLSLPVVLMSTSRTRSLPRATPRQTRSKKKAAAAAKSLEHTQAELAKANQTRAWLDQAASSQKGGGEGKGTTRTQQLGQGQPSQTNWQKVNGEWVSNKRKKQYEFAQKRTAMKKGLHPEDLSLADCAHVRSPPPAAQLAVLAHFSPDPDSPYVPHGLGAPKGLSVWEHVLFGVRFAQPDDEHQELLPQRALDAVNFELLHGSEFIDAFRSLELERLRHSARDLQRHRDQWLQANRHGDSNVNLVAAKLHGPCSLQWPGVATMRSWIRLFLMTCQAFL